MPNLIDELPKFLYDAGDRIAVLQKILEQLNHPDQKYQIIHVCGTNGKGSTSTMIAAVLKELGLKTGLFMTPHVVDIKESININGVEIPSADFNRLELKIMAALSELEIDQHTGISYFEMLFLMATLYFAEQGCEYVVLECGMGGELDATNAITTSAYTIVTKIGLDHMAVLGDTLPEIVATKIKIIRENTVVVVALKQKPGVIEKIEAECHDKHAQMVNSETVIKNFEVVNGNVSAVVAGQKIEFVFPLQGQYQLENIQTVLAWYQGFAREIDSTVLENALTNLSVVGRFETIKQQPLVIVDAAHNVDGIQMFKESVEAEYADYDKTIVMGFLNDKDVASCCEILATIDAQFILTEPEHAERALKAEDLARIFGKYGKHPVEVVADPVVAVDLALQSTQTKQSVTFVVGSFYLIKVVRAHIMESKE
jgi:dihydrofolate synthase/folylpolyglutamate synthase